MCSRASAGSLPGSFATTLRLCSGSIRVRAASASVPGKAKPRRVPACASRNSCAAVWPLPSKMRSAALALTVAVTRNDGKRVDAAAVGVAQAHAGPLPVVGAARPRQLHLVGDGVDEHHADRAAFGQRAQFFAGRRDAARGDPGRSASARRRTAPRSCRAGRARRNRRNAVPAPTRRGRRTPPAPRSRRRRRCSSGRAGTARGRAARCACHRGRSQTARRRAHAWPAATAPTGTSRRDRRPAAGRSRRSVARHGRRRGRIRAVPVSRPCSLSSAR